MLVHNRRQDYMSAVFRNIGFAFFTPVGSILFQWLVFRKEISEGHVYFSTVALLLGVLCILFGYIILRGEK